jgi:hypothetical protein
VASPDWWYRYADLPPPYNVHVRLQWLGRVVKGARGLHDGREVWTEISRGGGYASIRPDRDTLLWQPLVPDKWQLALPEPVAPSVGGMHGTTYAMSAVDDAVVPGEFVAPSNSWRDDDPHDRWWRGAGFDLRYEATGSVTRKMCEGRVMRALAHCGYGDNALAPRLFFAAAAAAEAGLAAAEAAALRVVADLESMGQGIVARERFEPLPRDVEDFPTAMGWVLGLNPNASVPYRWNWRQIVLWYRARDEALDWSQIGIGLIGVSAFLKGGKPPKPTKCRALYDEAINGCHAIANDASTVGKGVDRMAALRERNREARR